MKFYRHEETKKFTLARDLLESLKQVMDFKMQNGTLDFKTYISILEAHLIGTKKFEEYSEMKDQN
mgnify:CR=1 FL=1